MVALSPAPTHSYVLSLYLYHFSVFPFRWLSILAKSGLKVHIFWATAILHTHIYKRTHVQHLPSIDFLLKTTTFNYGFKWIGVWDIETSTRKQLYYSLHSEWNTKSILTPFSADFSQWFHFLMKAESNFLDIPLKYAFQFIQLNPYFNVE